MPDCAAATMTPDSKLGAGSPEPRPGWASHVVAARSRDARQTIASGQHPMPDVMRDLSQLREGEVYELITPFEPAPLIDMARAKGFDAYAGTEGAEHVRTYFRRRG